MTRPLDAAIMPLAQQQTIRTTYIVDIATPTPRKFTNYLSRDAAQNIVGGITVNRVLGTLTVTAGGTGYVSYPQVTFSGGGGQGAMAIAIVTAGAVTGFMIVSRGWGYTSAPTVVISGGGGTGATAVAGLGVTYPYAGFSVSGIHESGDGTSAVAATLTLPNAENQFTDLVTNAINARAPVSIQKVWRDATDAVAATEIWLEGFTGRADFKGEWVTLGCAADIGRSGATPRSEWRDSLQTHQVLSANVKAPWLTLVKGS
jgi:hypothetical protein